MMWQGMPLGAEITIQGNIHLASYYYFDCAIIVQE